MKHLLRSIPLAAVLAASGAVAQEIDTIAVLTPEAGTDFGWNQQGVEAAKAAAEATGLAIIVADGLGYGDVRAPMRELAAEGVDLMIAHASGYNTAGPEIAEETGVPVAIVDSPDSLKEGLIADYTLSGHEGAWLAGRMAAGMTTTGTVGIVVSGEPPSWNSQSAAFAQGVRAENPDVNVLYAVIGPAAYSDAAGGNRGEYLRDRGRGRHHLRPGKRLFLRHDSGRGNQCGYGRIRRAVHRRDRGQVVARYRDIS